MTIVTMYFGESIPGSPPLSSVQWARFAASVITPEFPDGFTVSDGQGQWLDTAHGKVIREHTKILTVAVDPSSSLAGKIRSIAGAYEKQFNQQSVGLTTSEGCGAF